MCEKQWKSDVHAQRRKCAERRQITEGGRRQEKEPKATMLIDGGGRSRLTGTLMRSEQVTPKGDEEYRHLDVGRHEHLLEA